MIPKWKDSGEIRDREKVMRGLKKKDTPILTGYQILCELLSDLFCK
jgi:hypothetical protein